MSGKKMFAAILAANLATMGIAYAIVDSVMSVNRTEAALARSQPVYTPVDPE